MLLEHLTKDEKTVLYAIQRIGIATKEDIMQVVDYKSTTLNRILDELKKISLVVVSGEAASTGGRRPLQYCINREIPICFLGINIGMHHIELSLLHISGDLLALQNVEHKRSIKPSQFQTIVKQLYSAALKQASAKPNWILGGCLTAFCAVDRERGRIRDSVQARWLPPEWIDFPVKEKVEACLHIPFMMDMTINAISIYEHLFGNCRGYERMAVMMCYHSLLVGCIQNDMLIRAADDMDNAFAHMVISVGGRKCECGDYGCVGAYGSAPSIVKAFVQEVKNGRRSDIKKPLTQIDVYDIMRAADSGDQLAEEIIIRAANMVAVAATNYINLTNPDVLVCAGFLNEKCDLFHRTLTDTISRKLTYQGRERNLDFTKRSELGHSAVGAATMAMESALGRTF